jgi:putative PIG3 family NAD(P)H quinone oxidoreductase
LTRTRAVLIREPGDPSVLELGDFDVRDPGPGELAVEVAAAGLNRADLLQRRGLYPPPPAYPPNVPGLEYAGTVAAVGLGVQTFAPGDRVMGIVGGGGMAKRVVVHEREVLPVPDGMSLTEAAAIPEVFLTAFDAIFLQAELKLGETVLIHAVGSGVGTAMLQLALAAGAFVLGTSRSAGKLEKARAFGPVTGIVPQENTFALAVSEATGGKGAQVILDPVGGAYLDENVRSLAMRGRLVLFGTMGGFTGELPLSVLMGKRARIIGTVLRARPLEEKANVAQAFLRQALPLFAAGKLRPVIDAVLPMSEVRAAHERMERNDSFGKLVLEWK